MHFSTLVTLDIPSINENIEENKEIQNTLEVLKIAKEREPRNIMHGIYFNRLQGLTSSFAREVSSEIDFLLEPYAEQTENPEYLEFEDRTDELREEYENGSIDCFKLPGGIIVSRYHRLVSNKFCIHDDGKVYQKNFGQLKHDKRSKKAKKMIGLKDYPYKKLCNSFEAFAGDFRGYTYYEKEGGYGFYYNPNAFYDWYQIGGRWADMFLVKNTCLEYSLGERSWANEDSEFEAPEGYMWVSAARKKDIEWQAMHDWRIKCITDKYNLAKEAFETGVMPEKSYWSIKNNKIVSFEEVVYIAGETLETCLKRYKAHTEFKYSSLFYAYFADGEYHEKNDFWGYGRSNKKRKKMERKLNRIWRNQVQRYVDSLADDTVMVCVDCHI